jgi:hypothetical protein
MGTIMEEWREVIGFEGIYKVSNYGQILSVKTNKIKKLTVSKGDDRPFVGLWKNNKITIARPHKLVLESFVCKRPFGMECCHNDGNPQNNHLSNLRWDTAKNNHADKVKHGTTNRGENCGTAKLTGIQVDAIRQDNRLQRLIAIDYGVRASTISRIKSGVRWKYH